MQNHRRHFDIIISLLFYCRHAIIRLFHYARHYVTLFFAICRPYARAMRSAREPLSCYYLSALRYSSDIDAVYLNYALLFSAILFHCCRLYIFIFIIFAISLAHIFLSKKTLLLSRLSLIHATLI